MKICLPVICVPFVHYFNKNVLRLHTAFLSCFMFFIFMLYYNRYFACLFSPLSAQCSLDRCMGGWMEGWILHIRTENLNELPMAFNVLLISAIIVHFFMYMSLGVFFCGLHTHRYFKYC